ncbi:MAG: ferrous iron transport protein B [Bacteroidota bacterium]
MLKTLALVGNPNAGKTSVFNQLTGLNQQVGNYPGVTVDKKMGRLLLDGHEISLLDLPGTYSLFPRSDDEKVVLDVLQDETSGPEAVLVVADATNLERNLLLFTQVYDLGLPVVLALNMMDVADRKGLLIDTHALQKRFDGAPVVKINARKGEGIDQLLDAIRNLNLDPRTQAFVGPLSKVEDEAGQVAETQERYRRIKELLPEVVSKRPLTPPERKLSQKLDRILVHPIWGYAIFLGILFLIFQAIYKLAEFPMDLIDGAFGQMSDGVKSLGEGMLIDLIADGIIPGLGGVVIFVPQILLLFAFLTILEETGYMARVVFIMDRLLRPFGLNGRSVVPLISGVACAIPAIMATRTIGHWKDRIITIMVTPLMSCSARLPVYTLMIGLIFPASGDGIFDIKGFVLLAMYLLGLFAALIAALVMRYVIGAESRSFLVMELPSYKTPRWKNVALTIWEKIKVFIWDAGKVIMAISIVLWGLSSYGPKGKITPPPPTEDFQLSCASQDNGLGESFIGILGKSIEPAIKPLGYDWKIGIALLTSFAAREVFVSSMAIIYAVEEEGLDDDDLPLREKMQQERRCVDGQLSNEPVYGLATGLSLMIFYLFAMQCMSTLAIVYRETKSWKWPIIQTIYMTALAYIAAWITFNLFS